MKEVGYYLHREGANLGKHCVPRLLLPSTLDAQFGTPYPRSAGFDTDIGALIESSAVSSPKGLMAPSIIYNNAVQGEVFLPEQIFVFGGFALQANSLGHLEQIDSYAPGHQVRFGSLNYIADIRRDLIFDGFEPLIAAPCRHDEHDLNLSSDGVREIAPVTALALDPEQSAPSEDGRLNPATEAADSTALEPNTDLTSNEACVIGTSESSSVIGFKPRVSAPIESDWAPMHAVRNLWPETSPKFR